MSDIYQVIDALDLNIPCTMATVLDGPFQGEKQYLPMASCIGVPMRMVLSPVIGTSLQTVM